MIEQLFARTARIIWILITLDFLCDQLLKPVMQFWAHASVQDAQKIGVKIFKLGVIGTLLLVFIGYQALFMKVICNFVYISLVILCVSSIHLYKKQILIFFIILLIVGTFLYFTIPSFKGLLKVLPGVSIVDIFLYFVCFIGLCFFLNYFIYHGLRISKLIARYCLREYIWANFKKFLEKTIALVKEFL